MQFWKSVFGVKQDNRKALLLFLGFFVFYFLLNLPFITYMERNQAVLTELSPFYGAPFTLNLFNFDPSLYYAPQASVIHPLINYLSAPLKQAASMTRGNGLFLGIQSAMNACGVVLMYYYLRRNSYGNALSIGTAAFFGASSYQIFSALIPDSYPYAVLIILLTVLYAQHCRHQQNLGVWPASILLTLNFGVTVTNVATAVGSLFISTLRKSRSYWNACLKIAGTSLLLVALLTGLQFVLFPGSSWITTWQHNIQAGGFSYVAPFSFAHHWKALYSMIESPIVTPHLAMIDDSVMAFVTNLSNPFPLYGHLIGIVVIVLTLLALVTGYRSKEVQSLAVYPLFALLLHIVVGFGLAAFQYDMYLYAGHYLFALFLLSAWGVHRCGGTARRILTGVIIACAAATLVHNIIGHAAALDTIQQVYIQIGSAPLQP
ncbi:DUF6080 domain-containing protein [Paenibacillus melissococcoides]|uniref:DUF6080 domain-containing protein n=1 Tax=Paenibacillus melissococcoides TaxID=2912268 RepID=A0ABN8U336_9BACL|nr:MULTISPECIES: DUF6080 domain-containing protein [Paenibacillus]MEB9894659.1 DUF6080 domain-containing protein [Bacillus cereus]CAH8245482.1 DUF6080 domain-containing protein [Paenibacillus melissococcoides]CAH8711075.1 DUF6080 domain-containing protein [Paenibacillus melissococcoides]CAH8711841.1 DUF6080 domain-containing protein [Paenibacillus melissococcoides]GIO78811.1 hypothetical protein J6TS7_24210 [Paenibacillus dendritiformis]